ncbi:major sperm protein, putative [Pediculus humanus corporis]|uniref:Major sperm protein, putative n=1 Tax=Pediculus humanus subsp. corporis TaxID=121224 RepID=E0VZQ7_PEDHC|nr:major sperm protein, putative [Pediculus humanus corporis]EEB18863.1 major sperm protein, putative [Pediculus humanus corporis]
MNKNKIDVQDLRSQFFEKLESADSDIFHPADINRVKTDDAYLRRFLMHHDGNLDGALNMLWDACEWRKKFGTNDISEKNVNKEILELGSVFPFGKDKDGKTLLVFKSKHHYKGAFDFEDHKKCLVYWMERLERQENGEMISLFFDMEGAVMANMDMDYTKYIISLFKNYYPYFLNYIIIFEMAWVLNAVFRVIKTLLPPKAVEKMKFVNKSNVKDYVNPDFALKSWGGKDSFTYHFEPEQKSGMSSLSSGDENKKKVHFADTPLKSDQEKSPSSSSMPNSNTGCLTTSDVMMFNNEGSEVTSSILLKNDDTQSISFKIKTTSPEKFRVRPSFGTLAPGANTAVSVVLLPGYLIQSIQRDKFLVMSIPIEHTEMTQQEINDLWKASR